MNNELKQGDTVTYEICFGDEELTYIGVLPDPLTTDCCLLMMSCGQPVPAGLECAEKYNKGVLYA